MFSEEQRRVAIETFMKYDRSYADTVAELGYPNRATLRLWWREYESTGVIPEGKGTRQSKYSDGQMRAAVDHYLEHGRPHPAHFGHRLQRLFGWRVAQLRQQLPLVCH
jgi:hypothetical protein